MGAEDLVKFLLSEPPRARPADDLARFWRDTEGTRTRFPTPIDWAIAGGFESDRTAGAFLSGYEAALHVIVPALDARTLASFSVTEETGNHPRAIRATLEAKPGGRVAIRGRKRWGTLAPLADCVVAVVTKGSSEDGLPRLKAVLVPRNAAGLTVTTMPATPFVPEVPHAEIVLDGVELPETAVLAGDGYADFVKPFRTIEDLHVQAAVLGYSLSAATRFGFPFETRERLVALALAARAVAALDPRRGDTHVALAGLLAEISDVQAAAEPHWDRVADAERDRWYRDRGLAEVAAKAREKRRERAWERLTGDDQR